MTLGGGGSPLCHECSAELCTLSPPMYYCQICTASRPPPHETLCNNLCYWEAQWGTSMRNLGIIGGPACHQRCWLLLQSKRWSADCRHGRRQRCSPPRRHLQAHQPWCGLFLH